MQQIQVISNVPTILSFIDTTKNNLCVASCGTSQYIVGKNCYSASPDSQPLKVFPNCYTFCPNEYKFSTIDKTCLKDCVPNNVIYESQCLTECPKDYCPKQNVCVRCDGVCPPSQYKQAGNCVNSCTDPEMVDFKNKVCLDCDVGNNYYYENQCVNPCPNYYAPNPNGSFSV
jgi:hypothetical protein